MKNWKTENCSEMPPELQLIAPDTYLQRRNIKEITHEEMDGLDAYTDYQCECREISVSDYNMLKSIEEIDTQNAIDDYTEQLVQEGLL